MTKPFSVRLSDDVAKTLIESGRSLRDILEAEANDMKSQKTVTQPPTEVPGELQKLVDINVTINYYAAPKD